MFQALPHSCPRCPDVEATLRGVALSETLCLKLLCRCPTCGVQFSIDFDGFRVAATVAMLARRSNCLEPPSEEVQ